MSRLLQRAAIVFVIVLAAAQFVRPDQTNPATDASHTLAAQVGASSALAGVVSRGCSDCHSNETTWPTAWYTRIAPVTWVIDRGVAEGRRVLNFSEWTTYAPARQRALLAASCQAARNGTMPVSAWTMVRPEAKLSTGDIETLCAAARGER